MVCIVAVADLHGHLPPIPECDLCLIAGDICPYRQPVLQARWLGVAFNNWLEKIPAKEVVGVAGNHDLIFERSPHLIPGGLRWHYLQDDMIELFGLRIWGTPWQPRFCNWAFNLDESDLFLKFKKIPEGTDVVVCHGPPRGFGDMVHRPYYMEVNGDGADRPEDRVGSTSLRDRILEVKPKLVVFGHIHEGRGVYFHHEIILANVSLADKEFRQVHDPVVFDISCDGG